ILAFVVPDSWTRSQFGELARALVGGMRDRAAEGAVILAGGVVLFVLGLLDDRKPLGPAIKGVVMVAVALLVAWLGNVRIAQFAGPTISIALTVAWIFIITNTFNFLDNMDGLSAGVAAICCAFLLICGVMAGQMLVPALAGVFLGAILGFLFF